MPAPFAMQDDMLRRDRAKGQGLHDPSARAAKARRLQAVSSGGHGPQTGASGGPQGHDVLLRLDDLVDETLKASFPASDPPAWTLGGSRREPHRPEDDMTDAARARPTIYVTTHDYERLSTLADSYKSRRRGVLVDFLIDELERAELVAAAEVGAKVVTMNSRVRIMDPDTGEARTVTLVYPGEEDSLRGRVSVFTQLGTALLGLPEGARMQWRTLDGRTKSVAVLEVSYQPESHGLDLDGAPVGLV